MGILNLCVDAYLAATFITLAVVLVVVFGVIMKS
jgi:hypothetical protein